MMIMIAIAVVVASAAVLVVAVVVVVVNSNLALLDKSAGSSLQSANAQRPLQGRAADPLHPTSCTGGGHACYLVIMMMR